MTYEPADSLDGADRLGAVMCGRAMMPQGSITKARKDENTKNTIRERHVC
jgi:hypothetical protein